MDKFIEVTIPQDIITLINDYLKKKYVDNKTFNQARVEIFVKAKRCGLDINELLSYLNSLQSVYLDYEKQDRLELLISSLTEL